MGWPETKAGKFNYFNYQMEKNSHHSDLFEIRSETSYSNAGKSRCYSVDSDEASAQELSYMIEEIIGEETKKHAPSKTNHHFDEESFFMHGKKVHSISSSTLGKTGLQIPKNLSRILGSYQMYPNIPDIQNCNSQMEALYGAFFGFLIGDIVGSHVAYISRNIEEAIPRALLMNGGGTYNLGSGQGTDQTEIMLCLCYGLLDGKGAYNTNLISQKYLEWYQSKPFNFSAVFALSIRELHIKKRDGEPIDSQKIGETLLTSSEKNKNQESSIGLIRILPLVIFGLQFSEEDFIELIKTELKLICPNNLVIESGIVYAKILKTIILTRDHGLAFFQASKWVYEKGSEKLIDLWKIIEKGVQIPSRGNMGKLKTSFTYACIEMNKSQPQFLDSLVKVLLKGGDTQTNCAIVMAIIGAIVGYNGIPNYFKQKIVHFRMKNSPRPREEKYSPHLITDLIQKMKTLQKNSFVR